MFDTSLLSDAKPRSSLGLLRDALKHLLPTSVKIWQESWLTLVVLQVLYGIGGQFFAYATDQVYAMGREDIPLIAFIAGFELVLTFLWSALWTLVICSTIQSPEEWAAVPISSRFNQLLIEQVRGLASVIWRMPLLLVPAIVQYVRLAFVPYIVALDRAYLRGEVDALQMSRRLSRGHFFLLSITLIITSITPWIAEEIAHAGSGRYFLINPIGVGFGWAMTLIINLLSSVFFLELFRGQFKSQLGSKTSTTAQPAAGLSN